MKNIAGDVFVLGNNVYRHYERKRCGQLKVQNYNSIVGVVSRAVRATHVVIVHV